MKKIGKYVIPPRKENYKDQALRLEMHKRCNLSACQDPSYRCSECVYYNFEAFKSLLEQEEREIK